jgi:hypothetical protein
LNGHLREYLAIGAQSRICHKATRKKDSFQYQIRQRLIHHEEYDNTLIGVDVLPLRYLEEDFHNRAKLQPDRPADKVSTDDIPENPIQEDI